MHRSPSQPAVLPFWKLPLPPLALSKPQITYYCLVLPTSKSWRRNDSDAAGKPQRDLSALDCTYVDLQNRPDLFKGREAGNTTVLR